MKDKRSLLNGDTVTRTCCIIRENLPRDIKSKLMKVLHIYRTYFPETQGGLEEAIRQICLSTSALGVENRVLTLQHKAGGGSVIERPEATVYRSPCHLSIQSCDVGFKVFPLYKQLLAWCDVVHYHFPWPFADMMELLAGGKPYLITYHSDIVRQRFLGKLYNPLMNRFLGKSSKIIATSKNYLESSPTLRNHASKVEIIPLSIDEKSYPRSDNRLIDQVESRFGRNFFLFVGVFRYYKGLNVLLEAIKGADYKLVIAGKGDIEAEVKKQAEKLGLENVVFPGYVSNAEKMALFELSQGVVFPSHLRSEAFGMTLVEGAMRGKPLISAEIGTGTSFVNQHGKTGLVVAPRSSKALREAMDYLHTHPEEAQKMGRSARLWYEENFTNDVTGKKYTDTYRSIVGP